MTPNASELTAGSIRVSGKDTASDYTSRADQEACTASFFGACLSRSLSVMMIKLHY